MRVFFNSPICGYYEKAVNSWLSMDKGIATIDYFLAWDREKGRDTYREAIAEKMNRARQVFLAGNYDYFFNVEHDIVLPHFGLITLLSEGLPIISGNYKLRKETNPAEIYCSRILDVAGPQDSDDRPLEKNKDFKKGDLVDCSHICFGCLLLKREVVEKIPFRDDLDVSFSQDAKEIGYKLITQTGVECLHIEKLCQV